MTATIEQTLQDRLFADLLLAMFDAGVAMGMGIPCERHVSDITSALIDTTRERWFQELEAERARARLEEPRLSPEEIPAWLRQQAELLESAPLRGRREL